MADLEEIREIIEPIVVDSGCELVDVQLRPEHGRRVLRVIIYKETGVGIDDCTSISRQVSYLFEVEDPIDGAYSLEVSSPGLDRPLTTERDFSRNLGKKVDLVYGDQDAPHTVVGVIAQVEDGEVTLELAGEVLTVSIREVLKAKLVIEF